MGRKALFNAVFIINIATSCLFFAVQHKIVSKMGLLFRNYKGESCCIMYSMKTDLFTRKTKIFRTELLVETKAFVYPGLLPADTNKNTEIEKNCQAFGTEKQFVNSSKIHYNFKVV